MASFNFPKLGDQIMNRQVGIELHRQVQEIVAGKANRRVGVNRGNCQRAEAPAQLRQRVGDVPLRFDVAADADANLNHALNSCRRARSGPPAHQRGPGRQVYQPR
jgi:hypothetical protein